MGLLGDISDGVQTHPTYLLTILIIPLAYYFVTYDKRLRHFPPGPKGYPIIGSMLDLADADKVPAIAEGWARDYGKISYTQIGGARYFWLNTASAVKELMDKRGSKYSSRPYLPMVDTVSGKARQFFMPYGDRWRSIRKISHAALNVRTSNSYRPVQDFESKQVMYEFLHQPNPEAFYDINRRYSASVIMTITYGYRVASWDDPVIKKIYKVLDHFVLMAAPGAWLVDAFPILTLLPSFLVQNWWKTGTEWFKHDSKVYLDLYRNLVESVKAGKAPDCFVKDFYLGDPEKNGIDELTAAYSAGSLVEAGSESTSTVINSWLLACLLYPHTVKAAQEELDRVVGNERMPTFEDEANLPYIRAMAKEILRWRPITKFGVNHASTEDDWYDGYFIPKGSVVMLNWWGIHFDPKRWDDPHSYEPMRFIDDPHSTAECLNVANPDERDHFTYGAGRRVCSGLHLAQNSLFINMARTLWAFNVMKAKDLDGNILEPSTKTHAGFLAVPVKFPCVFEPRTPRHAEIVEEAWKNAQDDGLHWTRAKSTI